MAGRQGVGRDAGPHQIEREYKGCLPAVGRDDRVDQVERREAVQQALPQHRREHEEHVVDVAQDDPDVEVAHVEDAREPDEEEGRDRVPAQVADLVYRVYRLQFRELEAQRLVRESSIQGEDSHQQEAPAEARNPGEAVLPEADEPLLGHLLELSLAWGGRRPARVPKAPGDEPPAAPHPLLGGVPQMQRSQPEPQRQQTQAQDHQDQEDQ
mmetsp:Transcript_65922/g.193298  ORF Transcript_65922/g.193298 Transcript_65922/m.193298 type:complete len:211 (+) Transcript_65922:1259-1891(+)